MIGGLKDATFEACVLLLHQLPSQVLGQPPSVEELLQLVDLHRRQAEAVAEMSK